MRADGVRLRAARYLLEVGDVMQFVGEVTHGPTSALLRRDCRGATLFRNSGQSFSIFVYFRPCASTWPGRRLRKFAAVDLVRHGLFHDERVPAWRTHEFRRVVDDHLRHGGRPDAGADVFSCRPTVTAPATSSASKPMDSVTHHRGDRA